MLLKNSEINNWYLGTYTEIDENCTEGDGYIIDNLGKKHEFDWLYEENLNGISHTGDFLRGYVFTWYIPRTPKNSADFVELWKENFKTINRCIRKTNRLHCHENGRRLYFNSPYGTVSSGNIIATLPRNIFGYNLKHYILEVETHIDNYLIIRPAYLTSANKSYLGHKVKKKNK